MDKIYYLDLQTLLEYLHGQSAVLSTEISLPSIRGPCKGYLFLKNSSIIGCLIQARDGRFLHEGEEAYRLLSASGEWQVHIDPLSEQTYRQLKQPRYQEAQRSEPSPSLTVYTPRQIQPMNTALLNNVSAKERMILRMVFTMINGQRTVDQIKAQLQLPVEVIEEALTTLRSFGVIE